MELFNDIKEAIGKEHIRGVDILILAGIMVLQARLELLKTEPNEITVLVISLMACILFVLAFTLPAMELRKKRAVEDGTDTGNDMPELRP